MNKKIELIERCKALGLQSGSLFDWLEMIESITAQRDALAQENKRLVEALEQVSSELFVGKKDELPGRCYKASKIALKALATAKEKP